MAIRTSESTENLMSALAGAQAKFGAAIKGNVNPAFRSKYADLSAVIDATLEHLNDAGIVVMQHPDLTWQGEVAYVTVTTRLQLKAEWMESDISIPAVQRDRFDAQSVGSAITYGCRYALQSILVVPREDDDANAATGRGSHEEAQSVGKAKVEALKAGKAPKNGTSDTIPSLFYVWHNESQTAEIMGDEGYKSANRDLLKPLWSANAKAIVATADQLEYLKLMFDERKVPFSALKAM